MLRKEQAGFRRGRGCIDQIFALRNIIEQCVEWNTPLLNINAPKTQVMCINATPDAPITVNGHAIDYAEDFTYLGSLVSKDNSAQKDIRARL